jgi:hypothetical protein
MFFRDGRDRLTVFQAQKDQLDAQCVAQFNKSPYLLLQSRGLQQDESATELDLPQRNWILLT